MPVATVGSPQTIALGAADALIVSCSAVDAVASVAGSTGFIGAPYELGRVVGEQGRRFGPYGRSVSLIVSSLSGSITAEVSQPSRSPDAGDALSASQAAATQALVSQDGILPRADTDFPAERVAMTASGCACASPCQIERIRCVTGTSVALTVYDNPAASSGTQLYSGTLSAGQEAAISTPIRAINGPRAVFASGSFDIYVSQEL